MAAILAALPGRLGLAIVLPDERELARLQYIVKCSKSIRHSGGGQVEAPRQVPLAAYAEPKASETRCRAVSTFSRLLNALRRT